MAEKLNNLVEYKKSALTVFWQHLIYFLKPEFEQTWPLFIYSSVVGVCSLAVPLAVQTLVNTISFETLTQPLLIITLLLVGALAFSAFLRAFELYFVEQISQRLYVRWFSEISFRTNYLDIEDLKSKGPITVANKFLEIINIQKSISAIFLEGITILLQAIVGFLILAFYHPFLLAFDAILFFLTFMVIYLTSRRAIEENTNVSNVKYKTLEWVQKLLTTISNPDKQQIAQKTTQESSLLIDDYLETRKAYFNIIFIQNIGLLTLQVFAPTILLGVGGLLVIKNQLTLGQLVAAELIVSTLIYGLIKINKLLVNAYDLVVSLSKFEKLLTLKVNIPPNIIDIKSFDSGFIEDMSHQIIEKERLHFEKYGLTTLNNYFSAMKPFRNVAVLLCFILLAIIFAMFLPWQQTSFGYGRVIAFSPQDRAQYITSPVEGKILKWYVMEGSVVKEGDPIVEMVDNDPDLILRLNQEKRALTQRVNAAVQSKSMAELNFNRQKILFKKGLSSKRNLEQSQMELNRYETDEANSLAELSRISVRMSRQESQLIKSPKNGTVFRVVQGEGGLFVKAGETLASIIPETKNRSAELWIKASDLPLLQEGQVVRLQFDGWPALQFSGWPSLAVGTFPGKIVLIDQGSNLQGKFRIVVQPIRNDRWPKPEYLRQGVLAQGWVLLSQVSIGFELWRLFNGFPPAYYKEIQANEPFTLDSSKMKNENSSKK